MQSSKKDNKNRNLPQSQPFILCHRQTTLPRGEVFQSTAEKFQADVDHILDCELRLLNQVVVARDDTTGFFNLAVVSDRLGPPSHHFVVEWPDGSKAVQPRFG